MCTPVMPYRPVFSCR